MQDINEISSDALRERIADIDKQLIDIGRQGNALRKERAKIIEMMRTRMQLDLFGEPDAQA